MFQFLRKSGKAIILSDEAAFWKHRDAHQRQIVTPEGPESEAEERLDLRVAQAIKDLLEREVGPEEGPAKVQMQNWDWNDDRSRGVYILRESFRPDIVAMLQSLLAGEFADFTIIVLLLDSWKSDAWGHIWLRADKVALQRNVAQQFSMA